MKFSSRAVKITSRKIVNLTYKVIDTLDKKSVKFMKMLFQFRKRSLEYGGSKNGRLIKFPLLPPPPLPTPYFVSIYFLTLNFGSFTEVYKYSENNVQLGKLKDRRR